MSREINKASDKKLIKAAQEGVASELARKKEEGKPISYWDKDKKKVYRLSPSGEKIYV